MSPERTDHWAKMRRYRAQFSGSEAFAPMRSSADSITITSESRFSVQTAGESSGKALAQLDAPVLDSTEDVGGNRKNEDGFWSETGLSAYGGTINLSKI